MTTLLLLGLAVGLIAGVFCTVFLFPAVLGHPIQPKRGWKTVVVPVRKGCFGCRFAECDTCAPRTKNA